MTGAPDARHHLPALDGVRAVAVMLVVWHHVWGRKEAQSAAEQVIRTISDVGWVGVDLFFVLSGFLITRILLRERDAPQLLKAFWWRRIVRILPVYYAYLFVAFVLLPAAGIHRFSPGPWAKWFYATFLSNVWITAEGIGPRQPGHLWSVAVEEQFYLLWPFVVLLARGAWLKRLVIGLLIATPLARLLASTLGAPWEALYVLTPFRLDGLAWGALLALLAAEPGGLHRWRTVAGRVGVVVGLVALGALLTLHGVRPDANQGWVQASVYSVTGMGFAAFLTRVITAPDDDRLAAWLSRDAIRAVGRWSYAIYVVHPMVLVLLRHTRLAPGHGEQGSALYLLWMTGFAGLVAGLSCAIAWASWHGMEKRLLALKDRVPYRPAPATGDAAG